PLAAKLNDGRFMVIGQTAEIYDPSLGQWIEALSPRVDHSLGAAAVLSSGNVLVTGSVGGSVSAELYDVTLNKWFELENLETPRGWHSAVRLGDGRVF